MNLPFRIASSILTAIWLSGCEALAIAVVAGTAPYVALDYLLSGPGQPYIAETEINLDDLKSIKTIALLELPDTSGYEEYYLEFGELGFSSTTQKFIKRHLEESGFKVIELPTDRKKSLHLKDNYWGLDSEIADAYLDIAPVGIGYVPGTFDQRNDDGFGPHVTVALRLVSARSKKVIYAGTVRYGWKVLETIPAGITIESPEGHRFEYIEAISEQKEEAIHHLEYGIEAVSSSIANKIATGRSLALATQGIETSTGSVENSESLPMPTALTDAAEKPVADIDVSGTYISEVTESGSRNVFSNKEQKMKITLQQNGNTITGSDSSRAIKISGTREGSTISFYIFRGNQIDGVWEINADATKLEGKWSTDGGGGASGKWNLKRVGPAANIIKNNLVSSSISKSLSSGIYNLTGTYVSDRIDTNWALRNKSILRIKLNQNLNSVEGEFFKSINGPIRGSIVGDKVEITWEAGNCNSGEGTLSLDPDEYTLKGFLLCRSQGMRKYDVVFRKM